MKKYILIVLLLILLVSCTYTYEWKGYYCAKNGHCEWMTGGGSEYCSLSYKNYYLPLAIGFSTTYYLVDGTCEVGKVWLY